MWPHFLAWVNIYKHLIWLQLRLLGFLEGEMIYSIQIEDFEKEIHYLFLSFQKLVGFLVFLEINEENLDIFEYQLYFHD